MNVYSFLMCPFLSTEDSREREERSREEGRRTRQTTSQDDDECRKEKSNECFFHVCFCLDYFFRSHRGRESTFYFSFHFPALFSHSKQIPFGVLGELRSFVNDLFTGHAERTIWCGTAANGELERELESIFKRTLNFHSSEDLLKVTKNV